mmetsp:Transcript_60624/g.141221  ORF Transcript_60624/g.141221 Transcript_60624/m.141221 type:complete len:206 (-) Transcript_60624:69-686(-)|eukprot:CAMPEP_0171102408 /NCGR_PEP_ID=MMETSP0766_2-20121228/57742_1 /TAXON_ID=439317 /ORGANISM="Gambierdiscus australes, Strain CAWD 149" /LENGTH=205 /DNA_ID=CAMNT_0011562699 /DNA_START=52 /DNA_END=669 /DNA_ORIENTATION=+
MASNVVPGPEQNENPEPGREVKVITEVRGVDVPQATSERAYECPGVIYLAFTTFFLVLIPFWPCFFAIKGPNGAWPYAWWSFVFLGIAGIYFWLVSFMAIATVTRTPQSFKFANACGVATYPEAQLEDVELMTYQNGCWCSEYIEFTFTDDYVKRTSRCPCCYGCKKKLRFWLRDQEHVAFVRDHFRGGNDGGADDLADIPFNTV